MLETVLSRTSWIALVNLDDALADRIGEWLAADGFVAARRRIPPSLLPASPRSRPSAAVIGARAAGPAARDLTAEIRSENPLLPLVWVLDAIRPEEAAALLASGADDVQARPLEPLLFRARLAALIRKATAVDGVGKPPSAEIEERDRDGFRVDLVAREVSVDGQAVRLGRLEFEFVHYLWLNAGRALSWEQIGRQLYGDLDAPPERIEALGRRVRAKLGESVGGRITAVPGYGYRWSMQPRTELIRRAV